MDKLSIKKSSSDFLISVFINACFLIFILLVFPIKYRANDDYVITSFVNGSYGFQDSHLVFINVIIGFLLKCLYSAFPSLPWYCILQFFLIFVSFTAICFVLLQRNQRLTALAVSIATLVFFAPDAYVLPHFTITTGLVTCAGLLLAFHAYEPESKSYRRKLLIPGLILALFGALFRKMQFFYCGAIVCFIALDLLRDFFSEAKKHPREALKDCFYALKPFILLIVLAVALIAVDKIAYLGEDWAYYTEYNTLRGNFLDYNLNLSWDKVLRGFDMLGMSESLALVLLSYNFLDTELVNIDFFSDLIQIFSSLDPEKNLHDLLLDYFFVFELGIIEKWAFCGLILAAVIWLFWGRKDKYTFISLFLSLSVFFGASLYLFTKGRYNIPWVDFSCTLSVFVVLLWLFSGKQRRSGVQASIFVLLFVLSALLIRFPNFSNKYTCTLPDNVSSQISSLSAREELIFHDISIFSYIFESPLDADTAFADDNLIPLGGWQAMYPPILKIMEDYGVQNPYRDCVDNDNICFFTDKIDIFVQHIREAYCPEAEAILIESVPENSLGLYKIVSK